MYPVVYCKIYKFKLKNKKKKIIYFFLVWSRELNQNSDDTQETISPVYINGTQLKFVYWNSYVIN